MSRVLNISGDYRIRVTSGGNIFLDPGSSGTVTITGNLDVMGAQTTIESSVANIQDNIVQINYDPNNVYSGNGIPTGSPINGQAGLEIWRGSYNPAYFVFDEGLSHFQPTTSSSVGGTFVLTTNNVKGSTGQAGLSLATIVTPSNSNFVFDMQNQPYVLTLANANGYENQVLHDNDIPNRKYVQQYVLNAAGTIAVSALWYPTVTPLADATTSIQALSSSIVFQLGGITQVTLASQGFTVNNVTISQNTVSNTGSSSANLVLSAVTGKVEVEGYLTLDNQATAPSLVSGQSNIYSSATVGPGKSGIYFNNNNAAQVPDELVSRSRAVALSILL
jgi:hypothetical protein